MGWETRGTAGIHEELDQRRELRLRRSNVIGMRLCKQ